MVHAKMASTPQGTRVLPVNGSLARAVQWALEVGYRHIDTATLYRVEDEVGQGVHAFMKSNNVDRRDLYLTTKVQCGTVDVPPRWTH